MRIFTYILSAILVGWLLLIIAQPYIFKLHQGKATPPLLEQRINYPFYDSGSLHYTTAIAVDNNGNVIIADLNYRQIYKFSLDNTLIANWQWQDIGPERDTGPTGLAVDDRGNIYAANFNGYPVVKIGVDGKILNHWGEGQVQHTGGIALDTTGHVYVTDTTGNSVLKFSARGKLLKQWGEFGEGAGQFYAPSSIAVDRAGHVYVGDFNNHRIQRFTAGGRFILEFYGEQKGTMSPHALAVDSAGRIYVAQGRIQVYTPEGQHLTDIRVKSEYPGSLVQLVAVDKDDYIYTVADDHKDHGQRIMKYAPVTAPAH